MEMVAKLSVNLPKQYSVEKVVHDNVEKYENIFYSNTEYYNVTDGRSATKQDIIDTIEYSDDSISIGVSANDVPVCFVSAIEKYPDEDSFYIGLMLVDEKHKSIGVGTSIIEALFLVLKNLGYKSVQLSVQDNNVQGKRFWDKMGFYCVEKTLCDGFYNLSMKCDL